MGNEIFRELVDLLLQEQFEEKLKDITFIGNKVGPVTRSRFSGTAENDKEEVTPIFGEFILGYTEVDAIDTITIVYKNRSYRFTYSADSGPHFWRT